MKRVSLPLVLQLLLLALVYFAAAELGLSLAALHKNVTPVWPPTGIAIGSLLILDRRLWPGVFLGALATNWLTDIPIGSAIAIAAGNTLEALVAVWLLQRLARWRNSLAFGDRDLVARSAAARPNLFVLPRPWRPLTGLDRLAHTRSS